MVLVYESEECNEIVGMVKYNANLGYINNGSIIMEKGITKLENGQFVIIINDYFTGNKHYAYVISDEEALKEIIESRKEELFELKKYKRLKELYEKTILDEED